VKARMLPGTQSRPAEHGRRRVLLARPRGYCAGVDRAVRTVELALDRYGPPVYVRRQIVHNTHVVNRLTERGAVFVEELDTVPGGSVVVFSAHGVAPLVRREAADRGLAVIDATCPLVTKVHKEAQRLRAAGYEILLIGHADHEEIIGTAGEAPSDTQVVERLADVPRLAVRDPGKVAWLSQTTLSVDETTAIVRALRARFPEISDPPSDDICYATSNRQLAIRKIAADAQLVIVVGSGNSSNSRRLAEVAAQAGAGAVHLVDSHAQISAGWLEGVTTTGVTSGASVPEELVTGVLAYLSAQGFDEVEEVTAVTEHMAFALPHVLRPAGRAGRAGQAARLTP
jgi:4-hydroxy-3-methylbut-2-en-1-yl diphosphate reductase